MEEGRDKNKRLWFGLSGRWSWRYVHVPLLFRPIRLNISPTELLADLDTFESSAVRGSLEGATGFH